MVEARVERADLMRDSFILSTDRVTKSFGRAEVVRQLNLCVPQRSIYGFLGPNGAGKTTTIQMVLGLMRPDRGEIKLFGLPIAASRKAILKKVRALFEEPAVYPHLLDMARLVGLQHRDTVQIFWSAAQLVLVSVGGAIVVTALAVWDFHRQEAM